MSGALAWAGFALQVLCFVEISVASIRHFDRSRSSFGMLAIRVLSLGMALGLCAYWLGMPAPVPTPLSLAALVLGLAGFALLRLTLSQTRAGFLAVAYADNESQALLTGGIYAVVRNPFYVAYLLHWVAWVPLPGGSALSVAGFAIFLALYAGAARQEEHQLEESFGQLYRDYRSRTGRFLPHLHRLTGRG